MLNHYKKIGLGLYLIAGYSFAEAPVLKMHIFKESPQTVKQPTQGGDLKMIIFDQNSNATQTLNNPLAVQTQMSSPTPQPKTPEKFRYWSAGVSTGYQYERIALQRPNIQEVWLDMSLWTMRGDFGFQLPAGFLLKGYAEYGFNFHDEDFNSRSDNAASGYTTAYSGALGYEVIFGTKHEHLWGSLTPLLGYSYNQQVYKEYNEQYNTAWQGPWAGVEFALGFSKKHQLLAGFDVHWTDFKAHGIEENTSLEYDSSAVGYKVNLGYRFKPSEQWALSLIMDYQHWQTDSGLARSNLFRFENIAIKSVKRDTLGVRAAVDVAF